MLKTELLEIIVNGEISGVEFKQDVIRPAAASQICVITAMSPTRLSRKN